MTCQNNKTKMRFIRKSSFGLKPYNTHNEGAKLLKLKCNMTELKANYKGKYKNALYRRCGDHEEYIEHIWECCYFQKNDLPKIDSLKGNNPKVRSNINKCVEQFCNI